MESLCHVMPVNVLQAFVNVVKSGLFLSSMELQSDSKYLVYVLRYRLFMTFNRLMETILLQL